MCPFAIGEELACDVDVVAHARPAQPASLDEISRVPDDQQLARCPRRDRTRRRHDAEAAQIADQRADALRREVVEMISAPLSQELLHAVGGQIGTLEFTGRQPPIQMRHHCSCFAAVSRRISPPDDIVEESRREPRQRPGHLNPQGVAQSASPFSVNERESSISASRSAAAPSLSAGATSPRSTPAPSAERSHTTDKRSIPGRRIARRGRLVTRGLLAVHRRSARLPAPASFCPRRSGLGVDRVAAFGSHQHSDAISSDSRISGKAAVSTAAPSAAPDTQ